MRITTQSRRLATAGALVSIAALAGGAAVAGQAAALGPAVVEPGTPGRDVHIGRDNDNADNPFIQPLGVTAKQHMDNTDILLGRAGDDLLVGNKGGDTLLAGRGSDILVGGPENFGAPNSDVLVGDRGNDINIWAPGDGSDAFLGQEGYDTMIFAPFIKNADGTLKLENRFHRKVPRVDVDGFPQFSCDIVPVPRSEKLGFQFLVRFNVNGVPAVTVRQKDVERVLCPSPEVGKVRIADLDTPHPSFRTVAVSRVGGVTGAIIAPTS